MKKWIQFNLEHPKAVLCILVLMTIISITGLQRVYLDSSMEAMMPKDSTAYRLNERAKKIFGDNKTFTITAIEAQKGQELFSEEVFRQLNKLVEELEEFKDFNAAAEEKRLTAILNAARVEIKSPPELKERNKKTSLHVKPPATTSPEADLDDEIFNERKSTAKTAAKTSPHDLEKELDAEVFDETAPEAEKSPVIVSADRDIWNLDNMVEEDYHVTATMGKNDFDFSRYSALTIKELKDTLDPVAQRQIDSILILEKMHIPQNRPLTKKEFSRILEKWHSLSRYKSMEIIKTSLNPVSGEDFVGSANELKQKNFIEKDAGGKFKLPSNENEFEEYKKIILKNSAFRSLLYSLDESKNIRALGMTVLLRPLAGHDEIFDFIYTTIKKYDRSPLELTPMGVLVEQKLVKDTMARDQEIFVPFVILVIIISFFYHFRTVRGVLLPAITVIMATLWTYGVMGLLGIPITIVVNMLTPLLIAVGSSYSIHIYNQYLHDQPLIRSMEKKEGLLISMKNISLTVFLAALTTFIGFLTLTSNQMTTLRDFGIFAALGTFFSMAIAVMLIPSTLVLLKMIPLKKGEGKEAATWQANVPIMKLIRVFSTLSLQHPGKVILVSLLFIGFFGFGISKIEIETAPIRMFKKQSYLYQADLKMGQLFDGTLTTNLVIDSGEKNGVKDPAFLREIESLREWITSPKNRSEFNMLHTSSFSDVIKRMHMAMNNDDPRYFAIPEKKSSITDYLEIYSGEDRNSDGRFDTLEQFIDRDFRYVNILIRLGSINENIISTRQIREGQKHIDKYFAAHPTLKKYRVIQTGEASNLITIAKLVVQGQVVSIILTLLIVAVLVFILFLNFRAGLLALIPISVSIIITYGFMGFFDIPLDMPKAILAAVALGIGVDDTIHMLKTLRHHLREGLSTNEAIRATHLEAGMAIVYTSLSLIFGFSVFLLSDFVPGQFLGAMIVLTMVSTTIAALVLLPASIVFFRIDLTRQHRVMFLRKIFLRKLSN